MLLFFTLLGAVLVPLGAAVGFFGILAAVVAICLSLAGLVLLDVLFVVSLLRRWRYEDGRLLANILGALSVLASLGLGFLAFENPLHDISTDVVMPPKILHQAFAFRVDKGAEYLDSSLAIPSAFESNMAAHALAYPGLEPVKVAPSPDVMYGILAKQLATLNSPPGGEGNTAIAAVYGLLPPLRPALKDDKARHLEYEIEAPPFGVMTDVVVEVRENTLDFGHAAVHLRVRTRLPLPDFGWGIFLLRDLERRIVELAKTAPAEKPSQEQPPT